MAESLVLSDRFYDPEKDKRPGREELRKAADSIKAGETIHWDEAVITELMREQKVLADAGGPGWLRVVLLIVALNLVLVVVIVLLLVKWVF